MPPPPPTAEERMRAPVVGGGRRNPLDDIPPSRIPASRQPTAEAGATLRSRMAEARAPESADLATRLDVRPQVAKRPTLHEPQTSDSIDIPIHVTGTTPSLGQNDVGDEMPTEIFRPGMHPRPMPPPRSASAPTAIQAPRRPAPRREQWSEETAIHRPEAQAGRVHQPQLPTPQMEFNPDETVRLDTERPPLDLDFSDETRIAPPRKRPQR